MQPDDNKGVYDGDDQKPVVRGLRNLEEKGSDGTGKDTGSSDSSPGKKKDSSDNDEGFYRPDRQEHHKGNVTAANLALAELSGAAEGGLFNPDGAGAGKTQVFKPIKKALRDRKKVIAGGGAAAGVVTIVVAGFMLFIPLKIEHMVNNLQKRTFAAAEDAVEDQTDNLLQRYIVKHALPAYKDCGTTISKGCTAGGFSTNPVGNLYRAWSDNKLENKLADKYGIEFKYDHASKNWYLKAPGTDGKGINIGVDGEDLDREFQRTDRAGMRAAIRDALKKETKWNQVMYRYKVGRLLEAKYGVKRCNYYCGKRDQLAENNDQRKSKIQRKAADLLLNQRVKNPRIQSMGIVIGCMASGNCNATDVSPTAISDEPGAPVISENAEIDTAVRQALVEAAANYPNQSIDELEALQKRFEEKGYSTVMLEEVLGKIGLKAVASKATAAIPVVGAVTTGAAIISVADTAGPAVQKFGYSVNSSAYVNQWQFYRTYADEIHTGHVNALEVGSVSNSLTGGYHGEPGSNLKQAGGTASAEQTALYQEWVNGQSAAKTASLVDSILPGKAYAATGAQNSDNYICKSGERPASGAVCPEVPLGQPFDELSSMHAFLSQPFTDQIASVAHGITDAGNAIGGAIGGIIGAVIPNLGVTDFILGQIIPFFQGLILDGIPSIWDTLMSGANNFIGAAGGADVAGKEFTRSSLGCKAASDAQLVQVINEQLSEEQETFENKSLIARMFDRESRHSLVSQIAMGVPFSTQVAAQNSVATMLNPVSVTGSSFSSIISGKAGAATGSNSNPFGTQAYVCTETPKDAEAYWDAHCSDDSSKSYQNDAEYNAAPGGKGWAGNTITSPTTGMPVNTTENPCLTIKTAVGSAGGWMDTSLLTAFDRATTDGNSASGQETAVISGDAQELARALVDSGRLSDQDGRYMDQIKNIANGNFTCNVNPYILEMLYGVVVQDKHTVVMSSLNRFCTKVLTTSGTGSYHYREGGGHAIDVIGFDGKPVKGGRSAGTLGYLQAASKYLPKGTGYGQVLSCSSGFNIPVGSDPIEDSCDHQHIQVPVKSIKDAGSGGNGDATLL